MVYFSESQEYSMYFYLNDANISTPIEEPCSMRKLHGIENYTIPCNFRIEKGSLMGVEIFAII